MIIDLIVACADPERTIAGRAYAFTMLTKILKLGILTKEEGKLLRSMVHLAFSKFVLERLERKNPGTPSEAEEISRANQKSEEAAVRYGYFQSEILKWEAKYKAECERTTKRRTQLMEMVEKTFYELKSISESTPEIHKWDCFISYPGGARELATRIFKEIDRHTRAGLFLPGRRSGLAAATTQNSGAKRRHSCGYHSGDE